MPKIMDLSIYINKTYGQLCILEIKREKSILRVFAKCTCGNSNWFKLSKLKNGHTKSCGCLHKSLLRKKLTSHGLSGTRIHRIWQGMHDRCRRKNSCSFPKYGAKGIKVCEEWNNFTTFYNWAIINGYRDDLTIDRYPNQLGNYEPGNCRWATMLQQAKNKTDNHLILYNGEEKTVSDWALDLGMNYNTLLNRINTYNWSIDEAFTTPVKKTNRWL